MIIKRMDNVDIVLEDVDTAIHIGICHNRLCHVHTYGLYEGAPVKPDFDTALQKHLTHLLIP